MINFFRYQYSSQISKLNSNIILYTKQNQNCYGSFCIYFVGGYRSESLQQQGSLLTLKNIKDQQNNKFLIQSSAIQNIQCQLEYYFQQNIFLNEDFEAALESICQGAFTQVVIPNQFQQIRQIFNENYASNYRIEIQRLIYEQFCLQKYAKQAIPECQDFAKFQNTQITSENCIIGYSGRQVQEKVVESLEKNIEKYKEFLSRKCIPNQFYYQFTNKTVRIEDNFSSNFEMALLFESSSCQNEDIVLIDTILAETLGRITDIQADIGIKIKSRCYDKLLQFNQDSLFEAGCLQQNFSDFGIFSLILTGSINEKRKIYDLAIEEVKKLKKISDYEIIRAKNIAITKYFVSLQRQYEQLNFDLKNIHNLGQIIDINEYKLKINNISKGQIEKRVNQLFKQEKLIILYRGRNVDSLPDEKMTLMRLNY